VISFITF